MLNSVDRLMEQVKAKNPAEPEFHQAVQEVADSLACWCFDRRPEYKFHPRSSSGSSSRSESILFRVPVGRRPAAMCRSTGDSGSR